MDELVERRLRGQDILCGGVIFELRGFWNKADDGSDYYMYLPRQNAFHVWSDDLEIIEYSKAQREADLLKRSVIDESIPLEVRLIGEEGAIIYQGGRRFDATLLGILKHSSALPELCEAAVHDLDEELRKRSIESIGDMQKLAFNYAPAIARRLLLDKSYWVRQEAARALGKIGNTSVVKVLREAIEEVRARAKASWELGHFVSDDKEAQQLCRSYGDVLQDALISLYRLDASQGREEFSRCADSGCRLVYHHAKNAFMISGAEEEGDTQGILPKGIKCDSRVISVPFYVASSGRWVDKNDPIF
jgi:hypothetical protein